VVNTEWELPCQNNGDAHCYEICDFESYQVQSKFIYGIFSCIADTIDMYCMRSWITFIFGGQDVEARMQL